MVSNPADSGGHGSNGRSVLPTVLLTDIEDSTRLWERHPDDMEHVVGRHDTLIRDAVAAYEGRLVKSTGDGALALFPDACDAISAAVEIQRSIRTSAWPGIGDLHIRIGLDTGACRTAASGDLLGRPPNLAARLQAAGHGGQILLSGATAAACSQHLRAGVELRALGHYLIRGFDDPIAIHMVAHDQLIGAFAPLRVPQIGLDDLPPDEGELVGRDDVVAVLPRLLEEHRLVTLWGPPGVGKARIAAHVARTVRRPYDDGVRFVDLSRATGADDVGRSVLAALHAQPAGGERIIDTVLRSLRSARLLLVLGHCEPVLAHVRPLVRAVLRECRNVRVLATSREPLDVEGEFARGLEPLPVPAATTSSLDELAANPSVQLFMSCLSASRPGVEVDAGNAELVAAACRTTDGLPLAIELAAARASIEGLTADSKVPAGFATRLSEAFAALDEHEAELLSHLAVFDGPFTRDLATRIAPDGARAGADLDRLVRRALVQLDGVEHGRFRLLSTCRSVAWDRLSESARRSASWRHARVMVERATMNEHSMRTAGQRAAVQVVRSEFAEYRSAFRFLMANDAVGEAAVLVVGLFQFCLFQPRPEGHQWAIELARRVAGSEPRADEVLGAAALGAWFAGDIDDALEFGRRSIGEAASVGGAAIWARTAMVNALGYTGDLEGVVPHFGALVTSLRRTDDPYWRINGLGYEAISLSMFDRIEEAAHRAERAIDIARELHNPDGTHWALYSLGRVLARDDPHGACEAYEQAMRAASEVDSRFNIGLDLVEWVALKRRLGEAGMAAQGALDLLDMVAVSGNRSQLSQTILEAGLVLERTGRHEIAAIALLSRRGLPAMPTGLPAAGEDEGCLARLSRELGSSWSRLRVRARALSEPELIDLCRTVLSDVRAATAV